MTMSIKDCIQRSQWTPLLREAQSIYFAPNIPLKKLQGALTYLPRSISPNDILILQDETLFGSARDGLCITTQGLFYKASFNELIGFAFEDIHHIEAKSGILNSSIMVNHLSDLVCAQLNKGELQALAGLLNDLCQSQSMGQKSTQGQSRKQEGTLDDVRTTLDLFSYFITYPSGRWDHQSRTAIVDYLTELGMKGDQLDSALVYLLKQSPHTDYDVLLCDIRNTIAKLSYETRIELIHYWVNVMALGTVTQLQAEMFMTDLCQASQISKATLPNLVETIYLHRAQQQKQQAYRGASLNSEQHNACNVLGIQPETLDEQSLQKAYRSKMSEFHPDKYQNLPESVRQLIEQQAQQLNQARATLKDYLES